MSSLIHLDETVSRITVVTPETHTSVCLGCGCAIELGRLYCEPCELGHELRGAFADRPVVRTCEGCDAPISDLDYDDELCVGICEDCREREAARLWKLGIR